VYPAFFIAPAMNPRTVWRCQPIFSIISTRVAPFFRWSIATTWAVLLPSRGPAVSRALAVLLPLGAFLAGVALFPDLPFEDAPLAPCARPLAFPWAFGFSGSAAGLAASPSPWMRSQIRLMAVFEFYNIDFRLGRQFAFTERLRLSLIGEAFNLFNHTNVSSVNTTAFSYLSPGSGASAGHTNACFSPSSTFLTPTATSNLIWGPRQLQICARLTF